MPLTKTRLLEKLAYAKADADYWRNEAKFHDRMATAARARQRPYQQRIDRYTKALDKLTSTD